MAYLSQTIGWQFVGVFMIVIAGRAHMTLVKNSMMLKHAQWHPRPGRVPCAFSPT